MRKIVFALLVAVSMCLYEIELNRVSLVSEDFIGKLESDSNGKSFMYYFYAPENPRIYINDEYQSECTIFTIKGEGEFKLTTTIPGFSKNLPYVGQYVEPRQIPFYLLQIHESQTANIYLGRETKTAHFPTNVPITYRILSDTNLFDYKLTLRGDDISMIESVYQVTSTKDTIISELKLEANKDNVFHSTSLKDDENQFNYLKIKIIKNEKKSIYIENFLQVDYLLPYDSETTDIDNKPQYLSLGQRFIKKTSFSGYDDFLIEFPEDYVKLSTVTLSDDAKGLVTYVVKDSRIHVTLKTSLPKNYTYFHIEIEFVVKRLPKVTDPILIARYDIEKLKNTIGFAVRGSYYDDKVYFKVLSENILNNNVYFAFIDSALTSPEKHQISIGYDTLPSSSEFYDFHDSIGGTQIVELAIDKHKAQRSNIIIICLKRAKSDSEYKRYKSYDLSLSYFEIKITKDIYKTIYSGGSTNYTLKKGQSVFINNYQRSIGERGFIHDTDFQNFSVKVNKGKVISYSRYTSLESYEWMYSSLDSLFTYDDEDEFKGLKTYRTQSPAFTGPGRLSSIIVITAITDDVSVSFLSHYYAEEEFHHEETLDFLN